MAALRENIDGKPEAGNLFRPRFPRDPEKWREVVELAKKLGHEVALARLSDNFHRVEKRETDDELRFDSYSTRIKSIEDLVAFHEIDTEVWEADTVTTNYYEQGAKLPSGEVVKTPLHQIKARFKRKQVSDERLDRIKKQLAEIAEAVTHAASRHSPKGDALSDFQVMSREGLEVELMITDLHLGKIGFDYDAMDYNWSVKECEDAYMAVIDDTLNRLKGERIRRFILPTGNDLLNIDNAAGTTTRGTQQLAPEFWETLFMRSARMVNVAIERLQATAPVKAIFVRGNHDSQSVFALGEQIAATYRHHHKVEVDNGFQKRKYHAMENVLLGFFHFDNVKPSQAHSSIVADVPHLAYKRHKAIHGGHYHKNLKRLMQPFDVKDEAYGIEVEVCPSLSPTDQWHYNNLFVGNLRRSKTFVWSPTDGLLDEMYYHLKP